MPQSNQSVSFNTPDFVLGILGCGALGEKIVLGLLRLEDSFLGQIYITGSTPEKSETIAYALREEIATRYLREYGKAWTGQARIQAAPSNAALARQSHILLLGVKPKMLAPILDEIREPLKQGSAVTLISLAGTGSLRFISSKLGPYHPQLARVMPNTAIELGQGMSAIYGVGDLRQVRALFSMLGEVEELRKEKDIDAYAAIACSTGFFLEAVRRWQEAISKETGISPAQVQQAVGQILIGVGHISRSGRYLPTAIHEVGKPGNSLTAAEIDALHKQNVYTAFAQSGPNVVKACAQANAAFEQQAATSTAGSLSTSLNPNAFLPKPTQSVENVEDNAEKPEEVSQENLLLSRL